MEDEIDIYADLPSFNLGDNENLAEKNKKISEKCTNLEKQVTELSQSLESLRKINNNLEVNISSLLQTAKAEIARKDRMIADIRRQLDNMQFRRGEYSRSVKPERRSPSRRKPENSLDERSHVVEAPSVPDAIEYMCNNPPPSINDNGSSGNKSVRLDGIVNTVFGERLRKKLLEEQEEERKQKALTKARAEIETKKTFESVRPDERTESDAESGLKADSLKSDSKMKSVVKLRNKGASLGSRNHSERKRQLEDYDESASSNKKSKINDGKNRCRDNSRHRERRARSSSKTLSKNKTDERSPGEIFASDDQNKYHVIDEYQTPVENDIQNKNAGINTADDNETQGRHNRVAIRLMLLSEGIDPDLETKKFAQNEEKNVVKDNREICKKSEETRRSRSKSKNRRRNHGSRSRTPDEYWKNRRRSRERVDRRRKSRDRFERRRKSKNKDGDNLSEFSREICDLKEKIEHRVDDGSSDRNEKGRSLNKHKRNDEKIHKSGRSRTPDSSRGGSKGKTVHKSRTEKQCGRSQSRERHKSRNRGKNYSNFDDASTQHTKTVVPERKRTENVEIMPTNTSPQATENPETKSLVSLEDGEIVDSAGSSPAKIVIPIQSLTEKITSSDCKLNSSNSDELASKIADVKCLLPLREIGNNQINEKSLLVDKPAVSIPVTNRSTDLKDSINSSKDERIENIAEFIANFSTDVSESKPNEKSVDEIIHDDVSDANAEIQPNAVALEEKTPKEKIQYILNTVFQGSSKDSPLVSPSEENSDAVSTKNLNGNNDNDEWCLIAIDSPIKNFEENRKNRIIAQNLQMMEKLEPLKNVLTDDLALKHLNESFETICADEACRKKETPKLPIQPIKNTSKTKPAVLTSLRSLRSTYHKGRKEMILSDTNSEQCRKILMPHSMNSATKNLSYESETLQQSRDDVNKIIEAENIRNVGSKSPNLGDVDRNSNNSQKCDEKESVDVLLSDQNDSMKSGKDKETIADGKSDIIDTEKVDPSTTVCCVDETTKKNEKSEANYSKTDKETVGKIGGNLNPDLRNSMVKESKSKQTTACKTDLSNSSKVDVTKNIESKNKTGCKVEKIDVNEESNINKNLENGIKLAKAISKAKVEGSNSKQKIEPQNLIYARRKKPVHLEDSSTSSGTVVNPNSFINALDNSEISSNNDIEPSNILDMNSMSSTEHGDNQAQKTIAKNDSANDHESEISKVKE